jgi:predicted SprT family Zn-dependent metalloprotease
MARLSYDSDSDDDFPSLQEVARRVRQQKMAGLNIDSKENAPAKGPKGATRPEAKPKAVPASLSNGTPLRRRKLGNPQATDISLFQKWNETTANDSDSRGTRVRSRNVKRSTSGPLGRSVETLSDSASESEESEENEEDEEDDDDDDDVVIRRRRPARLAAQKQSKAHVEAKQKMETVVSVKALDEDASKIEETVEISAIFTEDQESSSGDETSEFVTALSFDEDSGSEFQSALEHEPTPRGRRSQSPSYQRLRSVRLPPPKDAHAAKPAKVRAKRAETPAEEPTTPQTPKMEALDASGNGRGDLEDDFKKLQIYADELDDSPEAKPSTQLGPITPKKTLPRSPLKAPAIPPSPWKPEHNEFWDAEVQNAWVDKHSPPKRRNPAGAAATTTTQLVLEAAGDKKKEQLKKRYGTSPAKRQAKKAFDEVKEALAAGFLAALDARITDGQLGRLTAATGGVRLQWSATLQSTAGRAHWRCKEVTTTTQQQEPARKTTTRERRHEAWIDLASKVLTNEEDLLNTVAHEFCHLAVFMLNGKPKFAHGAEFKAWGRKCMDAFGADRGIVVTTKHNYEIDYKFIWRCVDCMAEVHRHSKSVDPAKQRCGRCRGVLEQVKPVPRAAAKGKTAYQEFVGREMKLLKAEGKAMAFKDMMAVVSKKWKAEQQGKKAAAPADKALEGLEKEFEEMGVVDLTSD